MDEINIEGSNFEQTIGVSKFVKLVLNNKKSNPKLGAIINVFGVNPENRRKEKVFAKVLERTKFLEFYAKTSKTISKEWIVGIPTIKFGNGIWKPNSGINLGKLKDYKKLNSYCKWDFSVKGFGELIFDLWLTKGNKQPISNDVEIMIVLEKNFNLPWEKIGNIKNFEILHNIKKKGDNSHVFAFIKKRKSNSIKLNFLELVKFCEGFLKKNLKEYNLRSIDFGPEFSNNTEIIIKLYKLVFNFKKK